MSVDKEYTKGPAVVEEPRLNETPFNVKRRAEASQMMQLYNTIYGTDSALHGVLASWPSCSYQKGSLVQIKQSTTSILEGLFKKDKLGGMSEPTIHSRLYPDMTLWITAIISQYIKLCW